VSELLGGQLRVDQVPAGNLLADQRAEEEHPEEQAQRVVLDESAQVTPSDVPQRDREQVTQADGDALLEELLPACQGIGAWGAGRQVLEAVRISGAGVAVDEAAAPALEQVQELLGAHRVWERFSTSL
jgi:hypothetical protein